MSEGFPAAPPGEGIDSREFMENAICWAVHHLTVARERLNVGDHTEFHSAMQRFGACAKAMLDTLPEVGAQQPHA